MQEEIYEREKKIIEKTEVEKEIELITSIIKTRDELRIANANFEFAEKELVDYYTYQIKANQAKLDYLLRVAKSKGIVVDRISEIKYRNWIENNEAV